MYINEPINLVIKMCSKNNENIKKSDFSIDHILNRAGEITNKINNEVFDDKMKCFINETSSSDDSDVTPQFDWLQYTRYCPPKLQRTQRIGPIKRTPGRLPRIPFTIVQLNRLEEFYKKSTYLSAEDVNKLSTELDLTTIRIKIWFQNRRARERRERKEINLTPNYNINSNISCNKINFKLYRQSENS